MSGSSNDHKVVRSGFTTHEALRFGFSPVIDGGFGWDPLVKMYKHVIVLVVTSTAKEDNPSHYILTLNPVSYSAGVLAD